MIEFQQAAVKASDDKSLTSLIEIERLAADERAALEEAVVTGNRKLASRLRDYAEAEIFAGVALVTGLSLIPVNSDNLLVSALTYVGQALTITFGLCVVPSILATVGKRKQVKRQIAEAKALLAGDVVDRA